MKKDAFVDFRRLYANEIAFGFCFLGLTIAFCTLCLPEKISMEKFIFACIGYQAGNVFISTLLVPKLTSDDRWEVFIANWYITSVISAFIILSSGFYWKYCSTSGSGIKITFILVILAVVTAFLGILAQKIHRKLAEKARFPQNGYRYSGLGHEPYWDGKLPKYVKNFKVPRYVYDDRFESETPSPYHGYVIGYRISGTLVIHAMVEICQNDVEKRLSDFLIDFGGHLLTEEDLPVLRQNWAIINSLRKAIGDKPLPDKSFVYKKSDGALGYASSPGKNKGKGVTIIVKR